MSQALYDSLVKKWESFLDESDELRFLTDLMQEDDVDELYDTLVKGFQKKYRYSEKTTEMAFHDAWCDTFKDMFYQRLEKAGVKIIHSNPMEGDWDYGKKFGFGKYGWEEAIKEEN